MVPSWVAPSSTPSISLCCDVSERARQERFDTHIAHSSRSLHYSLSIHLSSTDLAYSLFLDCKLMPALTSKATSASIRKSNRYSNARLSSHVGRRRGARKSRMRSAVLDLDDCFEVCRETGYHQDPDVHIGSDVDRNRKNGNPDPLL